MLCLARQLDVMSSKNLLQPALERFQPRRILIKHS
uniref:Uncharacterized protein n=1 Tax=Ascaris lumbricoides TaxID=6252 RepID=A0A0M3IWI1_ASCLU